MFWQHSSVKTHVLKHCEKKILYKLANKNANKCQDRRDCKTYSIIRKSTFTMQKRVGNCKIRLGSNLNVNFAIIISLYTRIKLRMKSGNKRHSAKICSSSGIEERQQITGLHYNQIARIYYTHLLILLIRNFF